MSGAAVEPGWNAPIAPRTGGSLVLRETHPARGARSRVGTRLPVAPADLAGARAPRPLPSGRFACSRDRNERRGHGGRAEEARVSRHAQPARDGVSDEGGARESRARAARGVDPIGRLRAAPRASRRPPAVAPARWTALLQQPPAH